MLMHETQTYSEIQLNGYDPTRTTSLRNAFTREVRKRYKSLARTVRVAIVEMDCFGLQPSQYAELFPPGRRSFAFTRTSDKVEAFMEWLRVQEERGILETRTIQRVGESIEAAWTNRFIYDSYKRGVMRARSEMRARGYEVPTVEQSGGLEAVMGAPFHVDTVGVLFTRAFSELRNITQAMDTVIGQVLSQGLVDGDNPRLVAQKLDALITGRGLGNLGMDISYISPRTGKLVTYWRPSMVRAETMARTEMIRAHHMANFREYENWSVEGVQIMAEWSTAGDDRVCAECAGLHGNVFSLQEIQHMIPRHPNCRCIALPVEKK